MADFYPVLSRAIAGLSDPTPEMRRAIYDRARAVLVSQLRGLDPPLSETDIARERLGLDETIARLEAELASRLVQAQQVPAPAPISAPNPTPLHVQDLPSVPEQRAADIPDRGEDSFRARRSDVPEKTGEVSSSSHPDSWARDELEPLPPIQVVPSADAGERPRVGPPPSATSRPAAKRKLIVIGGLGLAVAAIATTAVYVNTMQNAPPPARSPFEAPATPSAQMDAGPKINERVGADGAPASGGAQQGGTSPQPQTPRSGIAVAQRAVLYIESAENPQQPRTQQGRALWRLDSETVGAGQPVETVVSTTVDIPDAGLTMTFTIRRNMDAAFPASHIVGLRFVRSFDDGNGAIREAGVPQFKSDESERGAPLSAITSALGENLFVSALSNVPVEIERNLDVMTKRNWIDIPVRFASGRRGIIAFEKGMSGDQVLAEALNAWR